jgi:outer membrane protein TolC
MKRVVAFFLPLLSFAEIRTMTLREVIDLALKQNPEILLARFDEQKAAESVRIARDPFTQRLVVGSGLGATFGMPMSIEGSTPSIFQATLVQSLYNKPRSYDVAAARENMRGAAIDTAAKRDDVAYRTTLLYIDAEQIVRGLDIGKQQQASYEKIVDTVRARVESGRELRIELQRADLRVAQARRRVLELETTREHIEASLATVLGFGPDDRVRPVVRESPVTVPDAEAENLDAAMANSKELKRLESALQARGLEVRSAKAARLPQLDLLAQYAMLARFNNYEDFFNRFERHNAQLGVSIALPILPGGGAAARAAQGEVEIARLRTQVNVVRDRITLDTRKALQDVRRTEASREVAKLDLDVAREQLSVLLAQFEEGRATLRQVEEARALETEKWLAFYDAQHAVERARVELLRHTGTLTAAIR